MKWVVLVTLWAMWTQQQPTMEVRISDGRLRGVISQDGTVAQYFGIPYAYTDREHRFQAPLPVRPWDGVFNAIEENVRCPQTIRGVVLIGQEDCLRLNVYTPLEPAHELRPVMVWFHGGGFFEGSNLPSIYGPEYLVSKGVVLVTINYRLNIQGFLCLPIKEAPGNAGMKDQVAALKWVQRNIKAFGGNPDNVTIFGESAGAVSVSYHILSPMSKGLFNKAILQSGSSLTNWAHQYNEVYLASLLSKTMGYRTEDPRELYEIFMNKTDEELIVTRVPRKEGNIITSEVLYTPCVEKQFPGVEAFLTERPFDLLSRGEYNKVPMIIGTTNQEGLLFIGMENDTTISKIKVEKSMPKDLRFPTEKEKLEAASKLKRSYLGDEENITKDNIVKFSNFYGDVNFFIPSATETELVLKSNPYPVYNYKLSYDSKMNLAKANSGFGHVPGMTHADDIFYLFKPRMIPTPNRYFDWKMIETVTTLWTNFAKFGDPTPELNKLIPTRWNRTDKQSPEVFVIDREFSTEPLWSSDSLLIWRELYEKYRRK